MNNEQFTMPRKLAHELLGALFNGPDLNPSGYEALKQDFAARMRAAPVAAAVAECKKCDGHGATHYPDGEWEGKCATCKGTGVLPPADAAPVDAKPVTVGVYQHEDHPVAFDMLDGSREFCRMFFYEDGDRSYHALAIDQSGTELADLLALAKQAEAAPMVADRWPAGYAVNRADGHGWYIHPPQGGRWVAHEGTPAADFIAALAQRAASVESQPVATTLHSEAINALLSVATAAYEAMDNSEERANATGGEDAEYIIQGNDFTALSTAMDEIDALPDDRPGCTLAGGARARWALRGLFTTPPAQPDSGRDAARYRELRDHGLFVVSASGIGWAIRRDEAPSAPEEMDAAMDEHMRMNGRAAQQGEKGGAK